jgi:hypothetical protein
MIGTLNVMVLALVTYIVFDEPQVVVQKAAAMQTPTGEEERAPGERNASAAETALLVVAERAVPGAPQTDVKEEEAERGAPRRVRNGKRHAGNAEHRADAAPAKPKPTPRPADNKGPADLSIECIMNPDRCDRGGAGPRTAAQGPKQRAPEEDLPTTLGQAALRAGFGKVRDEAKACGGKHGVSDEQIAVKVSISGKTGEVTSARALGSHAKTGIGNCVASALRRASFDRFAKPQIGIRYTVRL